MTKDIKRRIYIVGFGDSDKYLVEFDDVDNKDPYHHTNPLEKVEDELKEYLSKEFPGQPNTYFTTPKVTEVEYSHKAQYSEYHPLDANAVEAIKENLKREMQVREANERRDRNAPFDEIIVK